MTFTDRDTWTADQLAMREAEHTRVRYRDADRDSTRLRVTLVNMQELEEKGAEQQVSSRVYTSRLRLGHRELNCGESGTTGTCLDRLSRHSHYILITYGRTI